MSKIYTHTIMLAEIKGLIYIYIYIFVGRIAFYNKTAVAPCDRLLLDPNSNPLHFNNVRTPWSTDTRARLPAN